MSGEQEAASAQAPLLNTLSVGTAGPRIAFLHGLFGQGRNWNLIAKGVAGPGLDEARCLLVDLPDHGRSPWTTEFDFGTYAAAVARTLAQAAPGERWYVVGHSLGGKTAMVLTLDHPELVAGLVVVDIAPTSYGTLHRFSRYIEAMRSLPLGELTSRADAEDRFDESDPGVKAFLLQNLRREGGTWHWQANLDLVAADAARGTGSVIADFPSRVDELPPYDGPVVWLNGAESEYVQPEHHDHMRKLFPRTRIVTVTGAKHWVHTDNPQLVIDVIRRLVASGT